MQTLTDPNYIFRFVNRSSNDEVKFLMLNNTDISLFKDRYNKFQIVTDTYFSSKNTGMYVYEIYEQSGTGLDITGLNMVESGIMFLTSPVSIYNSYQTIDTYKIRQ